VKARKERREYAFEVIAASYPISRAISLAWEALSAQRRERTVRLWTQETKTK
jgi:hypothetical protein